MIVLMTQFVVELEALACRSAVQFSLEIGLTDTKLRKENKRDVLEW